MFDIHKHTSLLIQTRSNTLKLMESLSFDQLNTIPATFKNHIAWNMIHSIASQQGLVYKLSGTPTFLDSTMFEGFKKGDLATPVSQEVVDYFKAHSISSAEKMKEDYVSGALKNQPYTEYPTSFGFTLHTVEDAIVFSNFHEGLHFGYMLAMKHLV